MRNEDLTHKIIGAAIEVHKTLGPGLLESAYQFCLAKELIDIGLDIQVEKPLPILYKDVKLEHGYRIDILVKDMLVIEVKAVETLTEVHTAQILTYMKLGDFPLGLLINFNVKLLTNGLKRFVL